MIKIYLLLICLLFSLIMRSQEDICIGKRYTLYSDVLQEERGYWMHLPESYGQDTTKAYPVLYLLDGESFFHSLVGISKTLASGRGKYLPPCIIVGVLSTNRTRDFTPTSSAAERNGKVSPNVIPQGGGSEIFSRFLIEELRSIIDNTYKTNGENMLIGHSYAGLFTVNTFLHHTELFDIYLALDPSLWWDQGKLSKEAAELIKGKDFTGKSLYIGVASKKRTDRVDIHLNRVNHLLTEILPQAHNLHFFTRSFPEENHGTIAIPGMYDGIKQLFGK
ncbi:putative alpha/beta superfamily hydrolase [Dysgonomonas sp. PFB1-18]|uniref:alpha/beta hydrolase n=1 Tax=unclassified Dysgonomonas TaxID=2630389 RepID=UPI002474C68A|nr:MULTISPECIES: alpha/beta hydrolase-fold protein [unclassified Dysgonomonas]MDL2303340.1 alpha/beta hydrolase [Dysgonomonas sp. OttesenSCG-928-D17]MDH6307509.1 putative alpha/beta superfamily hydrolase [Dysgonomonas sp. PF1-14]MDH6337427.1 putative alpha/beta superfamily hydrolase [Dysgonomonas sp. PF1-16]MDH6379351.1 putative alpha/beta superfamily hydrolase [Dysgonomonas sp. PFB1-18]MDH6396011.1 putative alpha/beta superfamily hydrolase [Dysgonomonas sp. PF1-23]